MTTAKTPLIAIVGPTASGKSDLAMGLAERFNGEIICADSRTVYRGMDIGTAKPTAEDQKRIPHHLLDVINPDRKLSAAEFKRLALSAISDIGERGKVPFLVGGSGLYIDSVIYDYQFPSQADQQLRQELDGLSDADLRRRFDKTIGDTDVIDTANRRRVIRAIETAGMPKTKRLGLRPDTLVLGLDMNKEVIQKRIEQRIEKMLERGFIDEVRQIGTTYGWNSEAMTGIGYRAFKDVVLGTKTAAEATLEFAQGDRRLVKKQRTWFRRNDDIHWLADPSAAEGLVEQFLGTKR